MDESFSADVRHAQAIARDILVAWLSSPNSPKTELFDGDGHRCGQFFGHAFLGVAEVVLQSDTLLAGQALALKRASEPSTARGPAA